ncbi:flavin-containing monooxygenase [Mycobacteroides abscessus]|uniref:flavin-containing monooxygenase n=1 Tax=Mycobacteroides abscessus TaxID=36809 RepID=UPI001A966B27|nr:NAD(P)/FAD-dependent oxidoreductase [Mycobacteroides abscessus]
MDESLDLTQPDHLVAVVGAGISGLGVGIRLKANGIDDFVILERAKEVGGTWRDNTYPGVAVDIPSLTYSFHFEPNPNWSRVFASGHELQNYVLDCVIKYGLNRHLRLQTEVIEARFDARNDLWRLRLAGGQELTSRFLYSAHGFLLTPSLPAIEGLEDFRGKTLRTMSWDHEYPLAGKRVAVIGTGASALQLIPAVAPIVKQLDVYQRTPIWVLPKPDLSVPSAVQALFRAAPLTQKALRVLMIGATELFLTGAVLHYNRFPFLARSIERSGRSFLERAIADPELREKLMPKYGFICKRPSFSNNYFQTFTRSNVELVTTPIAKVAPDSVIDSNGVHREIDALVLATGFKVGDVPYAIYGLDGTEIQDFWSQNGKQAYQGVSIPQYPNLFLSPGPYGITGYSWFSNSELIAAHAVRIIQEALRRKATRITVKEGPHRRFMKKSRERLAKSGIWGDRCAGSNSYYFDANGETPYVRPASNVETWLAHHYVPFDHYAFTNSNDSDGSDQAAVLSRSVTTPG